MDIIFFAAIAIFIFFKLREQLGKISDEEKEQIAEKIKQKQEKISQLQNQVEQKIQTTIQSEISQTIKDDKSLQSLDEKTKNTLEEIFVKCQISSDFFINGAKSCFEMILKAFSSNDNATLKLLLSEKILQGFEQSISDRQAQGKTLNTNLISIDKAEILSASILENKAFITVKFISKQINYITNQAGEITEGKKDEISELSDIWTFKKDLNDTNPNWKISTTG